MKKIILTLLLCLGSLVSAVELEGEYTVSGKDPYEQTNYSGTCTIKKGKNDIYQAEWHIHGMTFAGSGLLNGDVLSFIFFGQNVDLKGLQTYKITGAALYGHWIRANGSLVGIEKMVRKNQ